MIASFIAAAKCALVGWARKISGAIKKATTPLPSVAAAVAGVADDTTRTKQELVAQNALLRQQLVVLRRSVTRPRIEDGDRLIMVLLARLDSGWSQVLHIVQPDTLRSHETAERRAGRKV